PYRVSPWGESGELHVKHESSKTQAELETRRPPSRRALLRFEPREEALALRGRRPGCEAAPLGGMRETLILDGFTDAELGPEDARRSGHDREDQYREDAERFR